MIYQVSCRRRATVQFNNNAPFLLNIYEMYAFKDLLNIRWSLTLKLLWPLRPWYLCGYHCLRLAIGRETRSLIIKQPKSAVGGIIGGIAVELVLVCDHGDNKRFAEGCGQKWSINKIPIKMERLTLWTLFCSPENSTKNTNSLVTGPSAAAHMVFPVAVAQGPKALPQNLEICCYGRLC